jgi:hypothetical protein
LLHSGDAVALYSASTGKVTPSSTDAVAPSSRNLVVLTKTQTLELYDAPTGALLKTLSVHGKSPGNLDVLTARQIHGVECAARGVDSEFPEHRWSTSRQPLHDRKSRFRQGGRRRARRHERRAVHRRGDDAAARGERNGNRRGRIRRPRTCGRAAPERIGRRVLVGGKPLLTLTPTPRAAEVALSGGNLLVLAYGGTLALYDSSSGSLRKTFKVRGDPKLVQNLGVQGKIAIYDRGGLRPRELRAQHAPRGQPHQREGSGDRHVRERFADVIGEARIDGVGVAYGSRFLDRGRLVFLPWARVAAAVG